MTKVDLRRCSFVPYQPDGINICSWSPKGGSQNLAAVFRPKSGIELWKVSDETTAQGWIFLGSFHLNGVIGKSVEGLAWALDKDANPRLFSVGLDGLVVEWDLARFCPMRWVDTTGGGAAWCVAASPDFRTLAVGCENGSTKLVTIISSSGERSVLRLAERHLDIHQGGRVISVAFSEDGQFVATGSAQSRLSIYDALTGRVRHAINLPKDSVRDGKTGRITKESIVWGLRFVQGDLFSVDSNGRLARWSIKTGTAMQSFDLSEADLFALTATSGEEACIYAAGADQKLYELRKMPQADKWFVSGNQKIHSHDIRSLSSSGSLVLSGSLDTFLAVTESTKRTVRISCRRPLIILAEGILLAGCGSDLYAWDASLPSDVPPRMLLKVALGDVITHIALKNGLVACSLRSNSLKLFRMNIERSETTNIVESAELDEIECKGLLGKGQFVEGLVFDASGLLLAFVGDRKSTQIHRVVFEQSVASLQNTFPLPSIITNIRSVAIHCDNLAILYGERACVILSASEPSQVICTVAISEGTISSVHFNPLTDDLLFLGPKSIQQYNLSNRSFVDWPMRHVADISKALQSLNTVPLGVSFVPEGAANNWAVYGSDFLLSFNLSPPTLDHSSSSTPRRTSKRNRKLITSQSTDLESQPGSEVDSKDASTQGCRLSKISDSTIFFAFTKASEALLVERPVTDIMAALPPVFKRKKFGGKD